jgi:serine/threonine protein kinase
MLNPEFDKYLNFNVKESTNKILKIQLKEDNKNDYFITEIENEEENLPFKIVGDIQKKGEIFGFFNYRYLELDLIKGLIKRYENRKNYPKNPMETIPIVSLTSLRKLKKIEEFYPFEIIFQKNGKLKTQIYRVRHNDSREKWFDYLLIIYNHLKKNIPIAKIDNQKLLFIDDHVGAIQNITSKDKKKEKEEKISLKNFKILDVLGSGGFGTVYKVKEILTDKIYAMKVMNKNTIIIKKYFHYIMSEYEILKILSGCPFVLDIYYCFQSANYLYMVIDLCSNGDLTKLTYINNPKLLCAELILGIEYIHKHHIIYRDLKPENILLDSEGHIKICDFNLAKKDIYNKKRANSFCGSPMYLSPEMLGINGVSFKADIYQIGLIIYEIYTQEIAFQYNDINLIYDNIRKNKINFNHEKILSEPYLKDLLMKILVIDENKRYSIEQIKKHIFFKDINWKDVYNKKSGNIKTNKKERIDLITVPGNNVVVQGKTMKEIEFKLDSDKTYTPLDGKTTYREMKKDQKRPMKNFVREFYYVKPGLTLCDNEFKVIINKESK